MEQRPPAQNVICNDLVKRGHTVSVKALSGNIVTGFVDKIVSVERLHIQATQSLLDDSVYQHELASL